MTLSGVIGVGGAGYALARHNRANAAPIDRAGRLTWRTPLLDTLTRPASSTGGRALAVKLAWRVVERAC
jgi:hypothetical protein